MSTSVAWHFRGTWRSFLSMYYRSIAARRTAYALAASRRAVWARTRSRRTGFGGFRYRTRALRSVFAYRRANRALGIPGNTRHLWTRAYRDAPLYARGRSTGVFQFISNLGNYSAMPGPVAPGTVSFVNGIPLGDDINQMNGNKAFMHTIEVQWHGFTPDPMNAPVSRQIILALIYDESPQAAIPTAGDLLDINGYIVFQDVISRDRYKCLWFQNFHPFEYVTTGTQSFASVTPTQMRRTASLKLVPPLMVSFLSNGPHGTVADVQRGALYFVAFELEGAQSTQLFHAWGLRVTFTELE